MSQAQQDLKQMFPTIEDQVIQTVLESKDNDFEQALNILLEMASESEQKLPISNQGFIAHDSTENDQIAKDEELARKLQQEQMEQESASHEQEQHEPGIMETLSSMGQATKKKLKGFYKTFINPDHPEDQKDLNHAENIEYDDADGRLNERRDTQ